MFLALEVALVSVDLYENVSNSGEVEAAITSINQTQSVLLCFGNIVFDARKMELTNSLEIKPADFLVLRQHMNDSLGYLQNTIVSLIREEVVLSSTYGFTSPKLYEYFKFTNSGGNITNQEFEYSDAVFQLITTGLSATLKDFVTFNVTDLDTKPVSKDLAFIRNNALETFPRLANHKLSSLTGYFDARFSTYETTRRVLLGLRITSILIIFVVILPVILKLDRTNVKLLGLYRMIPQTDI